MPSELKASVEEINPRRLFPIHTEYPGLYAKYLSDTAKIEAPMKGQFYGLDA
jgi:mRNA degradation ribonuclease J1/J2